MRSRFRRARYGLVGLLVLWLIGRGVGLIGSAERGPVPHDPAAPQREAAASPALAAANPTPPPTTPSAERQAALEAPAGGEAKGANDPLAGAAAAVPLAEVAPPAEVPATVAPPAVSAVPAFDADRFASRLSLLQGATDDGRLGLAVATLLQLRELPLDGAQQAALVLPAERLGAALAASCGRLVELLRRGEVFAARASLDLLASEAEVPLAPWLHEALALAGVDVALLSPMRGAADAMPIARPLPRGRRVRVQRGVDTVSARVVDSRSDEATLRVEQGGGVAFPTVPVVAVEPSEPVADEAAEMGIAALQAGDVRLARLWLACARLRGGAQSPRTEQLATLLP